MAILSNYCSSLKIIPWMRLLPIHRTAAVVKRQMRELKLRPASMNNQIIKLSIGRISQAIRWISDRGCIGVHCGLMIASVSWSRKDIFLCLRIGGSFPPLQMPCRWADWSGGALSHGIKVAEPEPRIKAIFGINANTLYGGQMGSVHMPSMQDRILAAMISRYDRRINSIWPENRRRLWKSWCKLFRKVS